MKFNFPEILTDRTKEKQVEKVVDEVREYLAESDQDLSDKEAVDVLHAAETFLRVHFRGRMDVLDEIIRKTIEKNTKRGYYSQTCH